MATKLCWFVTLNFRMAKDKSFHDYIIFDVFDGIKLVSRAMFGGYGIYKNGKIFALIIENQFYLKSDKTNLQKLVDLGCEKFSYEKKDGKIVDVSYFLIAEEILEDQEKLLSLMIQI